MKNKNFRKRLVFNMVLMLMFVVFTPLLMNVSADATEEWVARYNGPANYQDSARAIAVDPSSGNIYVTGYSYGIGTNRDYATVAYDSDGNELWVARYNGPDNRDDRAHAIAVDLSSGNIYVTGISYVGATTDYATAAYDSSGNQLWVQRYNGPGNHYDLAWAIAVDPSSGNIYVTGESYGIGTATDYATVAYDSDGNELWVARYNGPGNSYDCPTAIAVDISGNIYVTGYSRGSGTHEDYATVAYDSDGNELWVARYNGPGNYNDATYAIAVDPSSGNIYVTGQSRGSETDDYATVAYDSSGNQLWVQRYNGPGDYFDSANDIAVDSSGNIYVTGISYGIGTTVDYATLKYPSAVKTATEDVIEDVEEMDLPNGIEAAMVATLNAAINSLDNDQTTAAINQLNAFINQVNAQRIANRLTDEEANALIASVQQIIDVINNL